MMFRALLLVAAATLAAGCQATPEVRPAPRVAEQEVDQEFDFVATGMLMRHVAIKRRLLDMEFAFTTYAARFCGDLVRPHFGALLSHDESFDDERWQEIGRREFGLGGQPTVVHLVPGGPAARAGLLAGDEILSLDGVAIASGPEAIVFMMKKKSGDGVRARFRRNESEQEVDVTSVPACPVRVEMSGSTELVPSQTEKLAILIPIGLLRFYGERDEEIAIAVGHQLAHALFDRDEDDRRTREERADHFGLILTAGAGYDVSPALDYWESVARTHPSLIDPIQSIATQYEEVTHSDIAARTEAIRKTVSELQAE